MEPIRVLHTNGNIIAVYTAAPAARVTCTAPKTTRIAQVLATLKRKMSPALKARHS